MKPEPRPASSMSALSLPDDVEGEFVSDPPWKNPYVVNKCGMILYIVILVVFNITFWAVALPEYLTDAKHYLDIDEEGEKKA